MDGNSHGTGNEQLQQVELQPQPIFEVAAPFKLILFDIGRQVILIRRDRLHVNQNADGVTPSWLSPEC